MERERNLLLHGQGEKLPEAGNSKQQDIISRKRAKVSTETGAFITHFSFPTVKASLGPEMYLRSKMKIPSYLMSHPVLFTNLKINQLILSRREKVGDTFLSFWFLSFIVWRRLNFTNFMSSLLSTESFMQQSDSIFKRVTFLHYHF